MKKRTLCLLLAILMTLLPGCRVRTTLIETNEPEIQTADAQETVQQPEETPPQEEPEESPEAEIPDEEPVTDPDAPSVEAEDSDRRTFEEDSSGEMIPDAEIPVFEPVEPPAEVQVPEEGEGGEPVDVIADDAELDTTETVPADEADRLGTDEEGEVADSQQTYYLTLLDSRLGALFECKRLYVYWETPEEYRTVLNGSREHQIILGAGAYDVSSKLLEENLTVDAGWVTRKNPDVIVKVIDRAMLEQGASICRELADRPEWAGITAVRQGNVLLIAEDLLNTQAGQIGAMLYLAKLMYPDQMTDVDPDEALRALTEEASGTAASGNYVYGL
ncbi:MAG: hypothetical protein IKW92_08135 [Firmicutes bacterium]|nr:hypothetical protein [Bacillota bacterium]